MRCAIWDGVGLYEFTQLSNCVIFDCRTAVGSSSKQQASMSIDNPFVCLFVVEYGKIIINRRRNFFSFVHFCVTFEISTYLK
ncbi:Protein MON2 [Trichinella spiralis]|uniref:Protein MON2 n=1 Tax=Trichinella spiralis TaxID=6334 RepID=A0ABR3K932_TRISP